MIPVFIPAIGEEEIEEVTAALRRGEISGTFGQSIPEFEERFAELCGSRHGIATSSGTSALQLAVTALDLDPGDEVLVSASTNIATALAPFRAGAVPVPVDSERATWNLDLDRIEELVTPKTKAIVPVHLYGIPVDMTRLMDLADRLGLAVVEDAAEAHLARWKGRAAGSFGKMGCFSFYANKVLTTGEGGMVVTDDDALAARLRSLRNLAFGKPRFLHEEAGYNYRMTGYQAAMGVAQCRKAHEIVERKRHVAALYHQLLGEVPGIVLPRPPEDAFCVYWMVALVVDEALGVSRGELMQKLRERSIDSRTFFCPMNQQPFLRAQPGFRDVPCPVADEIWERGLYLPSSPSLSDDEVRHIVDAIAEIGAGS